MKVLSLFDGMSAGRIALEKLGIEVDEYYTSEIKPHAIRVTQENYPDTIQIGDVTKVRFEDGILYTEVGEFDVGEIDLLIGGFPCQNISQAMKSEHRKGLKGDKSKLFFEFYRIFNEVKPRIFLVENVGSMNKDDKETINNLLDTELVNINSKLVSAQLRNILYWTNIPNVPQPRDKQELLNNVITDGWSDRNKSRCLLESDSCPLTTPLKMFHRYYSTGFTTLLFKDEKHYESCVRHYDENFKDMSAKEIDEVAKGIDLSAYDGVRYLNQTELERLQTVPEGYTSSVTRNQAASLLGDGWTVDAIAHIFSGLLEESQEE